MTGATDVITDGDRVHLCTAGHPLMSKVMGTGCMAASVLAAFAGVTHDYFDAAVCAMNVYGLAGEKAAQTATTPMAYKNEFIDCIYRLAHKTA